MSFLPPHLMGSFFTKHNDDSVEESKSDFIQVQEEEEDISPNNNPTASASSHSLPSSVELGSVDSSLMLLSDGMSINSDTLQDFGTLVSLPPGTISGLFYPQGDNEEKENEQDGDDEDEYSSQQEQQTIVSSAPSGTIIPPPEASQDVWALSPHPTLTTNNHNNNNNNDNHLLLGLSTVTTDSISYQNLLLGNDDDDQKDGFSSSSSTTIMYDDPSKTYYKPDSQNINDKNMSANQPQPPKNNDCNDVMIANRQHNQLALRNDNNIIINNDNHGSSVQEHHPVAFVTIANNLLQNSSSAQINNNVWYSNFTDADWERLARVASVVLNKGKPPATELAIPPSPPESLLLAPVSTSDNAAVDHTSTPHEARDYLPSALLCSLCNEPIVGALVLDCGCEHSTVCTFCWESHVITPRDGTYAAIASDDNDDKNDTTKKAVVPMKHSNSNKPSIWLEESSSFGHCPSCHKSVQTCNPCHALDRAILRLVQQLPSTPFTNSLKYNYGHRLLIWREEVLDRNALNDRFSQDEMLAHMIQQEETMLYNKQQATSIRDKAMASPVDNRLIVLGQTTVALLAAGLASFGIHVLQGAR